MSDEDADAAPGTREEGEGKGAPGNEPAGRENSGDASRAGAVAGETGAGGPGANAGPDERSGPLADEELGEPRRLDGRVRVQWVVRRAVGAVVGAVVVAVGFRLLAGWTGVALERSLPFGVARGTVLVGALAFALFFGVAVVRAVLLYRSWRYEVREDSLYLTRGVLTRVQTVAPYVRVQHVDTRRGPVERLLGLSSLVVYTAGSRGADVTIPGLTDERAGELQTRLKRLAIESEEEDAV